ncbi:conjugal transfer protein TraH [Geobacter sp. FeAm09]|uniref:conjugal transfer protein TraH n=1 Tax=Geobacter sp. FeAm09 TaxID=2597769 RepID=UPI00143D1FC0|nr:conjugal transfer protein TraH [Geobacter sp. FeAm09]
MRRIKPLIIVSFVLVSNTAFAGGFLDDWISSKTSGSANYYNGQKRGMLFGGSFSGHWPVSENNQLVTATPPHVSAGCGSIDFYGGNLAFLKPEMLVKKIQNVIQNSAYIAFEIAFDTLSSKILNLGHAGENLSNALNKMSMDDCTAAKGLVTTVRNSAEDIATSMQMGDISSGVDMALTDSYATLKQSIPAVKTLSEMDSWFNTQSGKPSSNIPSTSGCTDPILAGLFPSDANNYPRSAIQVIGNTIGLPDTYQGFLRGFIGDMLTISNGGIQVFPLDACPNNKNADLDFLTAGTFEVRDINMKCSQATDVNGNLQNYMSTKLASIMSAMTAGSQLSPDDTQFLSSMPLPVLYGLRMAILSGNQDNMLPTLAKLAATEWMAVAVNDAITRFDQVLFSLEDVARNSTDTSGASGTMCKLSVTSQMSKASIQKLEDNAKHLQEKIIASLQKQMNDFQLVKTVGDQLQEINGILNAKLQQHFSPSVAARMKQKLGINS